jgi:hypothetical protein
LQALLEARLLDDENTDSWTYIWGAMATIPGKSISICRVYVRPPPFSHGSGHQETLVNTSSFFWLLLRDRLNTRNLLRRKNKVLDDYTCALCNSGVQESAFHLFFECPFSQSCWSYLNVHWDLALQPLEDMIIEARTNFGSIIFREILITACWIIWKMRNSIIFYNGSCNLSVWKRNFKEEVGLVCTKAKPSRSNLLNLWRESLS